MITLLLRTLLVIGGILLAGCTSTIPVVSASLECPIKDEELNVKCAEPATVADGATYQDLVHASIEDRKNLVECEKYRLFLQNTISKCNAAIREHNRKIDEINRKYAGKP